ncbi:MAG: hypothetical protein DRM98_05640 [Thermoplasmata archaeon]|nr:MAG: hypothetical protein DRM98_05640 [Thermoplasmata archaeon]
MPQNQRHTIRQTGARTQEYQKHLVYTQLVNFSENDEYIVKVTRKTKEAQRNAIQNLMNSMMYDNADHN